MCVDGGGGGSDIAHRAPDWHSAAREHTTRSTVEPRVEGPGRVWWACGSAKGCRSKKKAARARQQQKEGGIYWEHARTYRTCSPGRAVGHPVGIRMPGSASAAASSSSKHREAERLRALINAPLYSGLVAHPKHSHAFSRQRIPSSTRCALCDARLWSPWAPLNLHCRCLYCDMMIHRKCHASATQSGRLGPCAAAEAEGACRTPTAAKAAKAEDLSEERAPVAEVAMMLRGGGTGATRAEGAVYPGLGDAVYPGLDGGGGGGSGGGSGSGGDVLPGHDDQRRIGLDGAAEADAGAEGEGIGVGGGGLIPTAVPNKRSGSLSSVQITDEQLRKNQLKRGLGLAVPTTAGMIVGGVLGGGIFFGAKITFAIAGASMGYRRGKRKEGEK